MNIRGVAIEDTFIAHRVAIDHQSRLRRGVGLVHRDEVRVREVEGRVERQGVVERAQRACQPVLDRDDGVGTVLLVEERVGEAVPRLGDRRVQRDGVRVEPLRLEQ